MANLSIENRSKELLTNLTEGLDFSIPNVDFNDPAFQIPEALANALQNVPEPVTIKLLTEGTIDGKGVFDEVMRSMSAHLTREYDKGRITGSEYTKAYIACVQSGLQFATQYALGKDTAYYQALGTLAQSLRANIDAYTAKVQLAIAQAQAHTTKAQYANTVLGLAATEKKTDLVREQTEQAHAQVSDTLLDGATPVTGYTGNQNNLLKQQRIAFKQDSIVKGAKVFTDSFATQLSMSQATVAGTGLDAKNINEAVTKLQESIQSNSLKD